MNSDNGNLLIKLIYLSMDHLMHNPKRAIIILFVVFILTMIAGELIGSMRNSETFFSATAIPLMSGKTGDYFTLPEIHDHGAIDLTPHAVFTATPTSEMSLEKTGTPLPSATQPVSCSSEMNLAAGKMAVIDYPGGYSADINVRYRTGDPNIIVGTVRSGDTVYLLDGPVCQSGSIWWKINSETHKIVGWIPEKIASSPILSLK